ncbi:unnamed protein product [Prunus armeniaca]|uniref:Uncharacterized protein n=1 Tax=Prunus armeniaca TaxID=36596 RepID=A0A6J5VSU9_PRUAR|nr:unnamed protein product [Prunus armeniaca]
MRSWWWEGAGTQQEGSSSPHKILPGEIHRTRKESNPVQHTLSWLEGRGWLMVRRVIGVATAHKGVKPGGMGVGHWVTGTRRDGERVGGGGGVTKGQGRGQGASGGRGRVGTSKSRPKIANRLGGASYTLMTSAGAACGGGGWRVVGGQCGWAGRGGAVGYVVRGEGSGWGVEIWGHIGGLDEWRRSEKRIIADESPRPRLGSGIKGGKDRPKVAARSVGGCQGTNTKGRSPARADLRATARKE